MASYALNRAQFIASLRKFELTEEVPDHYIGIDDMGRETHRGCGVGSGPDVSSIADAVVFDDAAISAIRPFCACNISLLENDLARVSITMIMTKPDV
jgi:hypothetical protein